MNASAGLPPAESQSSSRPEQPSVPLSPPLLPVPLPVLVHRCPPPVLDDCTTTVPLSPELLLDVVVTATVVVVTATGAACFGM